MNPERWSHIQALFHEALAQSEPDREAFVEARCEGDRGLAAEVLALLDADSRGGSLLDRGLEAVAHGILDGPPGGDAEGRRFGPYRVLRALGEGGMGVVYLARREDVGSVAAVKVLRDATLSPARRERFLAEQRTLARLTHPGIARLYDAGTLADGTPWFAMEPVDGVSFTEYCRAHASSSREVLVLMRTVCEAVQHAHQHAVIHRDLKPSNILVTRDGAVKLLDFGIAKPLDAEGAGADATRTGQRFMTPAYAAPEQISGGRIGVHTDIYSLGVVLYEALTGVLPFDVTTGTAAEREAAILARDPARPSQLPRRAAARAEGRSEWADLDVVCLTALQKDPSRRYGSVEALTRDLGHFLGGRPLEARADTPTYRAQK